DHRADGSVIRLQCRGVGFNQHTLRQFANSKLHVHTNTLLHLDEDALHGIGSEALRLRHELVTAHIKGRHLEIAALVCTCSSPLLRADIGHRHRNFGYRRPGFISDGPENCPAASLAEKPGRAGRHGKNERESTDRAHTKLPPYVTSSYSVPDIN